MRPIRSIATLLAMLAAGAAAHAATLSITVLDKDGQPAPDVAVLVRPLIASTLKPALPASVVVDQEKMQFKPFLTIVVPGTPLRFSNRDGFDHHIRGTAPAGAQDFEVRIAPQSQKALDANLEKPGRYALACHLHSSMRGYVLVSDTPWFARTDAQGKVTLEGLPDGPADVAPWHPEQFADQPAQRVTLGSAPVVLNSQLNFTPRKRRVF
jgi:plastocyanin